MISKWVNTKRMQAECLNKKDTLSQCPEIPADGGDHGRPPHHEGGSAVQKGVSKTTTSTTSTRTANAQSNKRILFLGGATLFEGAIDEVSLDPARLRKYRRWGDPWRYTLYPLDGKGNAYSAVDKMIDWSRLGEKLHRRRTRPNIRKLLNVHTPTRMPPGAVETRLSPRPKNRRRQRQR